MYTRIDKPVILIFQIQIWIQIHRRSRVVPPIKWLTGTVHFILKTSYKLYFIPMSYR